MPSRIRHIVFDLDGTLVDGATFNQLGYAAGVDREQWDNLKTKYRHDPDMAEQWGQENARMLQGLAVDDILGAYTDIPYAPGVRQFFDNLDPAIESTSILTSSVDIIAEKIARELRINVCVANMLDVEEGVLTGEYRLVVSMYNKLERFARLAYKHELSIPNTLYVGDNENDVEVMEFVKRNGGHIAAYNPQKFPELERIAHCTFKDYRELTDFIKRHNEMAAGQSDSTSGGTLKTVETVGVIILDMRGNVVLVRELKQGRQGTWNIPGGRLKDPRESYQAAARREAKEETGLDVMLTGFIRHYCRPGDRGDRISKFNFRAVPEGEARDPKPINNWDVAEAGWFSLQEIFARNPGNLRPYVLFQLSDVIGDISSVHIVGNQLKGSNHLTSRPPPEDVGAPKDSGCSADDTGKSG